VDAVDDGHDILGVPMDWLLRLHGVLDPAHAVPGLGASMSEALALGRLSAGEVTQQELGAHLNLEKSTVSRLVDAMAAKGWVDRQRDPDNRRYRKVRLTPAGERAAADVSAAIRQRHARILASLTPEERTAVAVGLTALARALARELGS
jgi:DNA-binding MarR family transcriptional regulator